MIGEIKLLAGLGIAASLLFAYQWKLHQAREEGRQECRDAAAAEYRENSDELSRIAARTRANAPRLAADAGAARSAADRLRGAVAGSGLIIRPAAAGGGAAEPVSETSRLSGELLQGCLDTARFADCLASGGEGCEASFEAVRR